MHGGSNSKKIRESILSKYYDEIYQSYLFQNDLQGFGIRYFEKQVEKFWMNKHPKNVLEIGGGAGEHLQYLNYIPLESYKSLDLRIPKISTYVDQMKIEFKSKFEFVTGDAQNLPFKNEEFDRVFSTCLLHHVDDVLSVLLEVRRVTQTGGEIAFVFPTDPGILNQLIKRLISYRKIRKMTDIPPELFYALDHKNHVLSISELIKFVFALDELVFHYRPFRFKSWNMNFLIVAQIIKKS